MNQRSESRNSVERTAFEEAAFNQRFLASIVPVKPGEFGAVGMPLGMSKDCPMMDDFIAKKPDGSYVEESLNYAWWAWQERAKAAPSETGALKERMEKSLREVFGAWHSCELGTFRNPIHEADKARGLKEGDLCDDCNSQIAAHLKDIFG